LTDHDGDPGIAWGKANAANDDGEAVMRAEREAGEADAAAGVCAPHGTALPCARCAADREEYLRFLHGQSRIIGLLAERTQAAQAAVTVLARYAELEAATGDKYAIGAAALADAHTGAEAAAAALRGVRRITDLRVAQVAMDLADAQEETEVARLRARCAELERQLAGEGSRG
jgi:hypothetical protein